MKNYGLFTFEQRKIFWPQYRNLKWILIVFFLILSIGGFAIYNVVIGSFSLFISLYLMGGFKTRQRILSFFNEDVTTISRVITNLIKSSREELKIICGSINPQIYGHVDISYALDTALKRGVNVFIITNVKKALCREKQAKENEVDYRVLDWVRQNRIHLFDIGTDVDKMSHFIISDRKSFRVESLHSDKIDAPRKAITSFDNRSAEKFLVYFDSLIRDNVAKLVTSEELQQEP